MEMIILLLAAGLTGFFLATRQSKKTGDEHSTDRGIASNSYLDRVGERNITLDMQVKIWALGDGAKNFPRDYRDWLAALSGQDAREYAYALNDYMEGLGLEPRRLFRGEFDLQPDRVQFYAETIQTYTEVYQKARRTLEIEG